MTEAERQALLAEFLRKNKEQQAMLSQSAMTPEQLAEATAQSGYDPQGKEAMLATMLRGGQDAVYGEMPQGRMMGNVYAQPSWSESLNGAAQKLVGGYQMGQARKEQTGIDDKRALSKAADAKLLAEETRKKELAEVEKAQYELLTDDQKAALEQQKMKAAESRFTRQQNAAESRLSRTLAARGNQPKGGGRGSNTQPTLYKMPDGSEVYTTMQGGVPVNVDTGERVSLTGAEKKTPKTDYQITTDSVNFGKRVAPLVTLGEKVNQLDSVLAPYMEKGMEAKDIPGLGQLEKSDGIVGDVARTVNDAFSEGAPAGEVNSAVRGVMNTIIRNQAGMSQTISEIERLTGESAVKLLNDPVNFLKYYDRLKDTISNDMKTIAATTPKETIESYRASLPPGSFDASNPQFQRFGNSGKIRKKPEEMTDEELAAELAR